MESQLPSLSILTMAPKTNWACRCVNSLRAKFKRTPGHNKGTQEAKEMQASFKIQALRNLLSWRILVTASVIINYLLCTFYLCFLKDSDYSTFFMLIEFLADAIFVLDVMLSVFLWTINYLEQTRTKKSDKWWILFDIYTIIPYSFAYRTVMILHYSTVDYSISYFLKMACVPRIYRAYFFFRDLNRSVIRRKFVFFIAKYCVWLYVAVHTTACIWFRLACLSHCEDSRYWTVLVESKTLPLSQPKDWYLLCMYFSLMTLTNTGLGDIYANNAIEMWVCVAAMSLGFVLAVGSLISALTALLMNFERRRFDFFEKIPLVKDNLVEIGIRDNLIKRVINYYMEMWSKKSGIKSPIEVDLLPKPLQMELYFDINSQIFDNCNIFRDAHEPFLKKLSLYVSHEFYQPGDIICHQDALRYVLICVTSGVIEVLSEDCQSPIISFTTGTCLGEGYLWLYLPSKSTIRAATYCELQVLNKTDFFRTLICYSETSQMMFEKIQGRIKAAEDDKRTRRKCEDRFSRFVSKLQRKLPQSPEYDDPLEQTKSSNSVLLDITDIYNIAKRVTHTEGVVCMHSFPWILQPDTSLVHFWDFLIGLVVLIICILYPYYATFERRFPAWLLNLGFLFDALFLLDIYVQLTTAVWQQDKLASNVKEILLIQKNNFGFYLDIFAIFPLEIVTPSYKDPFQKERMTPLLKLNRLFKVWKVWKLFSFYEIDPWSNVTFIRTVKYAIFILGATVWCGCILYLRACFFQLCSVDTWFSTLMNSEIDLKDIDPCFTHPFTVSVYFSSLLLSTTGYGDLLPENKEDIILACLEVVFGIILYSYCVAEFSATLNLYRGSEVEFHEVIYAVRKFMKENKITKEIQARVENFLELQWVHDRAIEIRNNAPLLNDLTWKGDILLRETINEIENVEMFKGVKSECIETIAKQSKIILFPPNEIVISQKDTHRKIFIIKAGYCEIISPPKWSPKLLSPGAHTGALEMNYKLTSMVTMRTLTHCKIICIDQEILANAVYTSCNFMYLAEDFNKTSDSAQIKQEADKIINETDSVNEEEANLIPKGSDKETSATSWYSLPTSVGIKHVERDHHYMSPFTTKYKRYNFLRYILPPCAVLPDGKFIGIWEIIRGVAAVSYCLVGPYCFAVAPYGNEIQPFVQFLNVLAYLDLIMRFFVAYYDERGILITHPLYTAIHYLKHAFAVDVIASFPTELFISIFLPPEYDEEYGATEGSVVVHHLLVSVFQLNRVLQIYRLPSALEGLRMFGFRNSDRIRFVKYFIITVIFLNIWTSILIQFTCKFPMETPQNSSIATSFGEGFKTSSATYHVQCLSECWLYSSTFQNTSNPLVIYIIGYYWITVTTTTVGFGDISAQTLFEMYLVIVLILLGTLMFGYMFASIASSTATANLTLSKHQEMLQDLINFMDHEEVDKHLRIQAINHFENTWERTSGLNASTIFEQLPTSIKEDATKQLYEETLKMAPIFKNESDGILKVISTYLEEEYFLKGTTIIRRNDVQPFLYIIYRGTVTIKDKNNAKREMGHGSLFGNISTKKYARSECTYEAKGNVDVLRISGEVLSHMKEYYGSKEDGLHILSNVLPEECNDENSDKPNSTPEQCGNQSGREGECTGEHRTIESMFEMNKVCLRPGSIASTILDRTCLMFSYLTWVLVLYQVAFHDFSPLAWIPICIMEVFFPFRIFVLLHTGYYNENGELVTDLSEVRHRYCANKIKLVVDAVINFPVEFLALFVPLDDRLLCLAYLRIIHLGRIVYIVQFYRARSQKLKVNKFNLVLSGVLIWTTLLAHFLACVWYMLACLNGTCKTDSWAVNTAGLDSDDTTPFEKYSHALYYIMSLITTTGYGDTASRNLEELVFAIAAMIISKFAIGILIGDISLVWDAYSASLVTYDYQLNIYADYLRNQNIRHTLLDQFWHYSRKLWTTNGGKQLPELIKNAPLPLRHDLLNNAYGRHIRQSQKFSKFNDDFQRQLIGHFRHNVFFPGYFIVHKGDVDNTVYFIHRGDVEVLTIGTTEKLVEVLMVGKAFGLEPGLPHKFTYRARTTVDILSLDFNEWSYLLKYLDFSREKKNSIS